MNSRPDLIWPRRTVTKAGGCFAAGTLVHTKDGLKPIEQIQVGDWVLSKPESGEGEQAYKRVVNTFSFEDKVVRRVRYSVMRNGNWEHERLIATNNHPFWVSGAEEDSITPFGGDVKVGWTSADELFPGAHLELATGESAKMNSGRFERLWKTKQADIAWESHGDSYTGWLLNTRTGVEPSVNLEGIAHPDFYDDDTFIDRFELGGADKWLHRCKVYNFEVEDFHTYYVGNLGAWVHNANCYAPGTGSGQGRGTARDGVRYRLKSQHFFERFFQI